MTKQLITLIGALVSLLVVVVAVMLGVVPLVSGALAAYGQRQQVASTNAAYETQIDALTDQLQRLDEVEDSVALLRTGIPQTALLNEVFERISLSEAAAGVRVESVTTADPTPYTARTGTREDPASAAAQPAPAQAKGAADPTTPIDATQEAAGQVPGAAAGSPDGASVASTRRQIELSVRVTASDMPSVFVFLDGLRAGPRAIAIDQVTVTGSPGSFDVQITAFTFIQSDGRADGGE